MLFWLLILAFVISVIITKRFSAQVTVARIIAALFISGLTSAIWYINQLHSRSHLNLIWQVITPTFYFLCFAFPVLFLLLYIILMLPKSFSKAKRRRSIFAIFFSIIMLTVTVDLIFMGFDAYFIEPNWIEVTHTIIKTPKWDKGARPLKIIQLSDLHIEKLGYREKNAINIVKNLKPDIIVLTGDYKNFDKGIPAVRQFMKSMNARYGVYAVDGNWTPMPSAAKLVTGTGVRMLNYNSAYIKTASGKLRLIGVPWHEYKLRYPHIPMKNLKPDEYVILLCHMPGISLHTPPGIDLILAGHTHGGQVRLPYLESTLYLNRINRHNQSGLSRLNNGTYLYVNRGIGMEGGWAPRIRFRCRPEISVITIRPEK